MSSVIDHSTKSQTAMPVWRGPDRMDPWLPVTRDGLSLWAGSIVVSGLAVMLAPLATFVILLGVFGLAHVLTELRYVDDRFARRLPRLTWHAVIAGVAAIAAVRVASMTGLAPVNLAIAVEVGIGAGLAALAASLVPRHKMLIAAGVLAFTALVIWSPFHALILIALLHNLTPLGFIAEALPAARRRTAVLALLVPFIVLPVLIATGLPREVLGLAGIVPSLWFPPEAGSLERQLAAFLPPEWWSGETALDLFAGAVFAQMMHYTAVILVLPRLAHVAEGGPPAPALPWPRGVTFWAGLSLTCLGLMALYAVDYELARGLYGVSAAIHAWLEVPLLALAAGGALNPLRSPP